MQRWRKTRKPVMPEAKSRLTEHGRLVIALWASEQSLDGFDAKVKEAVNLLNTDFEAAKLAAAMGKVDSRNLNTIAEVRAALRQKVGLP